jgi:ABC-type dipeptide/oligopeptide/nickel transport system ATPase component
VLHEIRAIRGRDIAMVFQDPMTSLNPVLTVGRQLTEVLETHLGLDPRQARERARSIFFRWSAFPHLSGGSTIIPHKFSGGMRQRVMIAMAVACKPKLLIADEPTTALDVTIQAQILEILQTLQRELGMALVLITHDLGVVAGMSDRVAVMYGGRIVEEGPATRRVSRPAHALHDGSSGFDPAARPARRTQIDADQRRAAGTCRRSDDPAGSRLAAGLQPPSAKAARRSSGLFPAHSCPRGT